jgi:hypothetical protein
VCPTASLDNVENRKFLILPELGTPTSFGRPALSQSPYRLRYPGSTFKTYKFIFKGRPKVVGLAGTETLLTP